VLEAARKLVVARLANTYAAHRRVEARSTDAARGSSAGSAGTATSITRSTSSGRPCLYPNDITAICIGSSPSPAANVSWISDLS
jgi:hypothetical protein